MTIEQINELTLEDCKSTLLYRLEVESATQEELEAEFELYKAELILAEEARVAEEEARIAEIARKQDLEDRFAALSDRGVIQGASGISNPAAYFRDEILRNKNPQEAEQKLAALENAYSQHQANIQADSWLKNRQKEYSKIDKMLLEAVAEKEAGRPEKMAEYLQLRQAIKSAHPKPE